MRSGYIIKSEALLKAQEIRQAIELSGLRIVTRTNITLTPDDVATLYPNEAEAWANTDRTALVGTEVEAGVVEGEHALGQLFELTGRAASSSPCGHNTEHRK